VFAIGLGAFWPLAAQDKPLVVNIYPPSAVQNKPETEEGSTPTAYSKEAIVFEKVATSIREESDGTGTLQTTARVRIQADAGVKAMAVLQFTYTASNQQLDIAYVRVTKPDGTVVVTPDYNVQDLPADVTRTAPMYSDIHQKHVAVKGLGVGDTLEYQTKLTTLKPEVPGHFWFEYSFQKDLIILDEQIEIDIPADKQVTVASAAGDPQPTMSTAAGRKLYHWSSSNLARQDPNAPPKSLKHVKPSIQVTTFTSWEQVGAWYQSLQHDSVTVTPAIKAKVDTLTQGLTSDEDKTRAIFNDVALNIHYVGLEFGIGRYQPHAADDVLSNEYGDCKDKHTLLAAELKAVGIEAWPVLISTNRELDPGLPSPAQFNHVISLVSVDGKLLWMDSTEEVAPIGQLTSSLRDKQALAIPAGKPAYLEHTPAELSSPKSIHFSANGELTAKGLFTAHIAEVANGDTGAIFRLAFRRTPQSQWKDLLERIAHSQSFAGEVSNPTVSDVEKIADPFNFSFDYSREKFFQWDDHDNSHWIGPPMPPLGAELPPGAKTPKPADEPDLSGVGETIFRSKIQLPDGWTMSPPKDVDLIEDWAEYRSSYTFYGGSFAAERRLIVKKSKVPLDQWDKYLAFRRAMYEDWSHQVLISPRTRRPSM
jgi:hypothetical protein